MNELVTVQSNLPDNLEDLSKFVLVGTEKLKAVKAEISAISKIGLAKEVYEQKKAEAQGIAEAVQMASVQVGKILNAMPKASGGDRKSYDFKIHSGVNFEKPKAEAIAKLGINRQQASQFQQMAANEDTVKQAIQKARDSDDVVSRAFIMGEIKKAKRKEIIQKQVEDIEQGCVDNPDGLFDVIAIDPPWSYGTQYSVEGRRVANPYPEMTQEQLKKIEIPAAENCVMFLWTTHKFIWDAKELLDIWGFPYRSMLVWDKQKMGMGVFLRMQCEFCLIGIKGEPVFRNNHGLRDIISEPRREHSRKPEAFYSLVDSLCVGRKLDYFSRERREGWKSYGNDVGKF